MNQNAMTKKTKSRQNHTSATQTQNNSFDGGDETTKKLKIDEALTTKSVPTDASDSGQEKVDLVNMSSHHLGNSVPDNDLFMDNENDEYIVPQVIKVVSLADDQEINSSSHSEVTPNEDEDNFQIPDEHETENSKKNKPKRHRKKNKNHEILSEPQSQFSYSGNNIVLVSNDFDNSQVPPSCVDNASFPSADLSSEEAILGLDFESEYDESDLNQKFASWSLSTPCQPDDRVDYFSPIITSVSSGNHRYSYQAASAFQIGPEQSSSSNYSTSGSSISYNRVKSPDSNSGESSICGSVPCSTIWDELRYCEAKSCSSPANKKCAQCKSAFYCCEDHQKEDWKRHKDYCIPYRVRDVGIGAADELPVCAAVAVRNIPAGQVIFTEKPILTFPLPMVDTQSVYQFSNPLDVPCVIERTRNWNKKLSCESIKPACLGCLKVVECIDLPSFPCCKCGLPLCSYKCQFLTVHQAGECEAISSIRALETDISQSCHHSLYMDVEILRALQLEKYDRLQWENFLEMKNNVRVEAYKKTHQFSLFAQNIEVLVPFSTKISGYNCDLISDVHAIINSLSFRPSMTSPFKLLFTIQPLFAHDCVPNTIHFLEDGHTGDPNRMKLTTKAACPIIKSDIITIDFCPTPYVPYPHRRKILAEILSISNCLCHRCQSPGSINDFTAEINCPICRCGTVCPETPVLWQDSVWSCRNCQEEISFSRIQQIELEIKDELLFLISQPKNRVVNELLDFIRRRGELDLNPKHYIILMAWCQIESVLRKGLIRIRRPDPSHKYSESELTDFEIMGRYADIMLEHLDSIRPGIWVDKGIVLFHKFYSSFAQVSKNYQVGNLPRKEFVKTIVKSMKTLQQALQTMSVYEGCNAPSVIHLTQEATSALSSLKEYIQYFLNQSENAPLPTLAQVLNRS